MGKGLVSFRDSIGLRSEDQSGNSSPFLAYRLQNFGKPLGVFGLRQKEIGRVRCNVFSDVAVVRAAQENCVAAIGEEILLQKTGNEVFLDIKKRLHGK